MKRGFCEFESRHGHNSSPIYQKLIIACPRERDTIFLNTLCKSTQGLYQDDKYLKFPKSRF